MKWITSLDEIKTSTSYTFQTKSMAIGSCFSEHIKKVLSERKFPVCSNPFGVMYNPLSIAASMHRFLHNTRVDESELILHNHLFRHFDMHSSLSASTADKTIQNILEATRNGHRALQQANIIWITWGTATVYVERESNLVVANNHTFPSNRFTKRMLDTDEITTIWIQLIKELLTQYPKLHFAFTVSPVRHIRDGLIDSSRSKARLIEAAHQLCDTFPCCDYFPAYEIMMDELRDYRFYEADLIHPNKVAVEYIFDKMMSAYFPKELLLVSDQVAALRKSMEHKALHPDSDGYKLFLEGRLKETLRLQNLLPFLDWSEEMSYFSSSSNSNASSENN